MYNVLMAELRHVAIVVVCLLFVFMAMVTYRHTYTYTSHIHLLHAGDKINFNVQCVKGA